MNLPSDRLLNWMRSSGDPFWTSYVEFLEYKKFFYKIFDSFCGADGKATAVLNFIKLQNYVHEDSPFKAEGVVTDADVLKWFEETHQELKKLDRDYAAAIKRAAHGVEKARKE